MPVADTETAPRQFEREAETALVGFRDALASLVAAIRSPSDRGAIRGGADLQRVLGISNTLAWQVYRVAHASDALAEGRAVPRRRAVERLLAAAAEREVPQEIIRRVAAATAEFEGVVKRHARSRREFDSMVSGVARSGSAQVDLTHRRYAYMGNSHIWGVQTRTNLCCTLLHPGTAPGMHDVAHILGHTDLQRLRRNAPLVIARLRFDHEDGVECQPVVREAIDAAGNAAHGVALLREFCTQPLPKIRATPTESGFVSAEIVNEKLGKQSEVTCLIGHVTRNVGPIHQQENDRHFWGRTMVRTPAEVLVHDVLVFDNIFGPIAPRAMVYGDQRVGDTAAKYSQAELLLAGETVRNLGRGPSVVHTADVPRYPEMVQYVCDRLGWDATRFDVYRCRLDYPIMPSSVVIEFELPEQPVQGS